MVQGTQTENEEDKYRAGRRGVVIKFPVILLNNNFSSAFSVVNF